MADKLRKAQYPRDVGSGRWQARSGRTYSTWHEALRDTGQGVVSAQPVPVEEGKSPVKGGESNLRGRLVIALIIVGFCALLVKADLWRSTDNAQLCGWQIVMIEAPSSAQSRGTRDGRDCVVRSGSIQASFRLHTTSGEGIIDLAALQRDYQRITGGASTPGTDLSWPAAFSLVDLLWNNRFPMVVYEAPDHRRGYILAPLTEKMVLAAIYVSDRPESVGSIQRAVRLHLNPSGRSWLMSPWIKLANSIALVFLLLPFAVVALSRPIFQSFDRWWDLQTRVGMILYCVVVPGSLAFFAWIMLLASGWSTLSFGAILLAIVGIGQVVFNLGRDQRTRIPLNPYIAPELNVFYTFRATQTNMEIGGAEIPTDHSLELEVWVPRRANCQACKLSYAVYVPSAAECRIGSHVKSAEDVPLKTRQDLMAEAVQAAPQISNGCIRCQKQFDGSSPALPERQGPFPVNLKWGFVALVCFALAVLIFWRGGLVIGALGSVPWVGSFLGELLSEFAGLIMTLLAVPALYFLWRGLAGLSDFHLARGSSLRRMSACPREGIVFEDIHASRNMTCPNCKEDREPIRHFRIIGA